MKTCPRCGKEVEDGATTCGHCSNIVEDSRTAKPSAFRSATLWGILTIIVALFSILVTLIVAMLLTPSLKSGILVAVAWMVFWLVSWTAGTSVVTRAKNGIYVVFVLVPLGIIGSFLGFLRKGAAVHFVLLLVFLLLSWLSLRYCYRRSDWFR